MQYNPFIPLIPHTAVTNNDTVAQIRGVNFSIPALFYHYWLSWYIYAGIISAPTMALESASLVLVYGLDVYFNRVNPSKVIAKW